MRKLITFILSILFLGTVVSAQTYGTEMLYQKYKGEEGIISIWLPGIAMKIAASIADLEEGEEDFLRSIRSLRVLTIDDNSLYPEVNFAKEARFTPGKNGFQVLVEISDGKEDVLILGREKNDKLKDILILVGGEENVMVHIKGRMNTDMIESIAQVAGLDQVDILSNL